MSCHADLKNDMRRFTRKDYPKNWEEIRQEVIKNAEYTCQECGREGATINENTGSEVILTVHHIDENPGNNERENLICLCQGCHLAVHRGEREDSGPTPILQFHGEIFSWSK